MFTRRWMGLFLGIAVSVSVAGVALQARITPGTQANGQVLVTTGQTLTPIGRTTLFQYLRPKDLAVSPDGKFVALLTHRALILLGSDGAQLASLNLNAGPLGVAFSPDGGHIYASGSLGKLVIGSWNGSALVKEREVDVDGTLPGEKKLTGDPHLAGLAVSPDGGTLYAAMTSRNAVAVVDIAGGKVTSVRPTGVAPYHVRLSPDGTTLALSNRGGRRIVPPDGQLDPDTNEPFKGVGVATANSAGTPVQIDPATDAAWRGTVSLLSTKSQDTREVTVGGQPSGLCFSGDGRTLYVADSNSDELSVVDAAAGRVERTLSLKPEKEASFGQIPTDVSLSSNGRRLFVTLGGINAVATVELGSDLAISGYVPTGWFPIAVRQAGDNLIVASTKGIGARPADKQTGFGVHDSVGMLQSIPPADLADTKANTQKVANNNGWNRMPPSRLRAKPVPIPVRLGEPSLFKHVVYIIKENLTYDSVLGDLTPGNGDPSLCTFGEEVTPNHHALAREFVLLDNFYTSGTNSADGHQWTSSAVANAYDEQNYASNVRSYPYDGGDPLAYSPQGFLWTAAHKAGKSVRVYGEFVNRPKVTDPATGKTPSFHTVWEDYKSGKNSMIIEAHTDNAALRPFLHPHYIGFPNIVSDQWRADQFLADLDAWGKSGQMPDLCMMLLPNDHTSGARVGMPTPRASVADNDLALGRIVEAISKSRFWPETLIVVVEDDSQLGLDHVDGHRTAAFCISPYTRRGQEVSTMYNHLSLVHSIELVLGIPPMTRFDAKGVPMTDCFTDRRDLRPYSAKPNRIPLDEMNPSARLLTGEQRELALECNRLDWSDIDRADAETVTRAVWASTKPGRPFPDRHYHATEDADSR